MPVPELQILGLGLDVIGAFVISIPDIPFLRRYHRAGRLRNALSKLDSQGGLSKHETGFSDLREEIHSIKPPEESDFDRPPDVLAVQTERLPVSPLEKIYGFYSVEESDEMVQERYSNIPYPQFRIRVQELIGQGESKIRAGGFLTLAGGFIVQILSLV
ncbi:MAG: hypothetical protein ABEJ97_02410 [Halobellus sp.]